MAHREQTLLTAEPPAKTGSKPSRAAKFANLALALAANRLRHTAPFVRILPTDRCNLNCSYCHQRSQDPLTMSRDGFDACLDHAKRLRVGLCSFLGGEPTTWPHLEHAIRRCTELHVLTDLTSNGTLLDADRIDALGRAGLDFLNLSVDVTRPGDVSVKSTALRPDRLEALLEARAQHGLRLRFNSVLFKDNSAAIEELVELTHRHAIPISIGFVVSSPYEPAPPTQDIYFGIEDTPLLNRTIRFLVDKKRAGYSIIDPSSYFENVHRFLRGESFWDCNYPKRFGWLNVTPAGRIRSCTKKMDELPDRFVDLNPRRIRELRALFADQVATCNTRCYSNCAYDAAYFARHLPELVWRMATGSMHTR